MKKTILIEILLFFVFVWLIYGTVIWWSSANYEVVELKHFLTNFSPDNFATFETYTNTLAGLKSYTARAVTCAIISTLATLSTLAAIIVIAIKDISCFKLLIDKIKAKLEERKIAKAEKAEADKQARIEQLQAELDELKKDE